MAESNEEVLPLIMNTDDLIPEIAGAEPAAPPALKWSYTPSGAPLVLGDVPDVLARVREEYHWPIWYLVAEKLTIEKFKGGYVGQQYFGPQDIPTNQPRVFKVVDTIVGWSIHEAPEERIGLAAVEQTACFVLPKIPWVMIQKLDIFFRSIDKQHGTEAIVILTWNPKIGGSEGWGIVVPDQENTGAHCKYDADSIVDAKDDDAFVVGSVHSHPGMSAFASGTDHADQADFDGVHITFGWSNSKNAGQTEYHAEMQMGGKAWSLEPEDIFLDMPAPEVPEEIKSWQTRVKPKVATPTTTPAMGPAGGSRPQSSAVHTPMSGQVSVSGEAGYGEHHGYLNKQDRACKDYAVTHGFPDPDEFLLIAQLTSADEKDCPTCRLPLDQKMRDFRRCHACWNFLALPDEKMQDVVDARRQQGLDLWDLGPRNTKKKLKWVRRFGFDTNDGAQNMSVEVTDATLSSDDPLSPMEAQANPLV